MVTIPNDRVNSNSPLTSSQGVPKNIQNRYRPPAAYIYKNDALFQRAAGRVGELRLAVAVNSAGKQIYKWYYNGWPTQEELVADWARGTVLLVWSFMGYVTLFTKTGKNWEPYDFRYYIVQTLNGTGNPSKGATSKNPARKNKKGLGGGAGASGKPAKSPVEFVSAETASVRSNVPMLNANYPSNEWFANSQEVILDNEVIKPDLLSHKKRLGVIEQSIFLHQDIAQNQGVVSKRKKKKHQKSGGDVGPHRWRFKFHYNPPGISVGQGYSEQVDPLYAQKDAFVPIDAQSSITLQLYLNRLEEMQILDLDGSYRLQDSLRAPGYDSNWGWRTQNISKSVRSEIRRRGTMYDLEYLFRCCNGEPVETWRGTTADIGILYAQPVVLRLSSRMHKQQPVGLAYYGVIQTITINHIMFTLDMVPTITSVDITMNRLPDQSYSQSDLGSMYKR